MDGNVKVFHNELLVATNAKGYTRIKRVTQTGDAIQAIVVNPETGSYRLVEAIKESDGTISGGVWVFDPEFITI